MRGQLVERQAVAAAEIARQQALPRPDGYVKPRPKWLARRPPEVSKMAFRQISGRRSRSRSPELGNEALADDPPDDPIQQRGKPELIPTTMLRGISLKNGFAESWGWGKRLARVPVSADEYARQDPYSVVSDECQIFPPRGMHPGFARYDFESLRRLRDQMKMLGQRTSEVYTLQLLLGLCKVEAYRTRFQEQWRMAQRALQDDINSQRSEKQLAIQRFCQSTEAMSDMLVEMKKYAREARNLRGIRHDLLNAFDEFQGVVDDLDVAGQNSQWTTLAALEKLTKQIERGERQHTSSKLLVASQGRAMGAQLAEHSEMVRSHERLMERQHQASQTLLAQAERMLRRAAKTVEEATAAAAGKTKSNAKRETAEAATAATATSSSDSFKVPFCPFSDVYWDWDWDNEGLPEPVSSYVGMPEPSSKPQQFSPFSPGKGKAQAKRTN